MVPGAKTNLRGVLRSSLRLRSARSTLLVAELNSSIQSEVMPAKLVTERLLARTSLRTTGTPTLMAIMLVEDWTALSNMPKTSSELVVPVWCTSTAMTLSPVTRLSVAKESTSATPSFGWLPARVL